MECDNNALKTDVEWGGLLTLRVLIFRRHQEYLLATETPVWLILLWEQNSECYRDI